MVITVTPEEGYIITKFAINGESVLDREESGRYAFTAETAGTYTVEVSLRKESWFPPISG